MIKKERYEPEKILVHVRGSTKEFMVLDGDKTLIGSPSLFMYKQKGISCIRCGRVGTYFVKERKEQDTHFHLTLYTDENDKEIMFTKDHITPISDGGTNDPSNLQPMCIECNEKKAEDKSWTPVEVRLKKFGKAGMILPTAKEREIEAKAKARKNYEAKVARKISQLARKFNH